MLILTRCIGETLMIGNEVTVTALASMAIKYGWGLMRPRMLKSTEKRFMRWCRRSRLKSGGRSHADR